MHYVMDVGSAGTKEDPDENFNTNGGEMFGFMRAVAEGHYELFNISTMSAELKK